MHVYIIKQDPTQNTPEPKILSKKLEVQINHETLIVIKHSIYFRNKTPKMCPLRRRAKALFDQRMNSSPTFAPHIRFDLETRQDIPSESPTHVIQFDSSFFNLGERANQYIVTFSWKLYQFHMSPYFRFYRQECSENTMEHRGEQLHEIHTIQLEDEELWEVKTVVSIETGEGSTKGTGSERSELLQISSSLISVEMEI